MYQSEELGENIINGMSKQPPGMESGCHLSNGGRGCYTAETSPELTGIVWGEG